MMMMVRMTSKSSNPMADSCFILSLYNSGDYWHLHSMLFLLVFLTLKILFLFLLSHYNFGRVLISISIKTDIPQPGLFLLPSPMHPNCRWSQRCPYIFCKKSPQSLHLFTCFLDIYICMPKPFDPCLSHLSFLSFSTPTVLFQTSCLVYQTSGSPKLVLKPWKHYKNVVAQISPQTWALGICVFNLLPSKFSI